MDSKHLLSLNDLLNLHYKQVDLVHKLWNYLWLAGFASITVSISSGNPTLIQYLIVGFVLFAVANARLVYLSQNEANLSAAAVKALTVEAVPVEAQSSPNLINDSIRQVVGAIAPLPAGVLLGGHLVMSAFVLLSLACVP